MIKNNTFIKPEGGGQVVLFTMFQIQVETDG